MRCRTCSPVQAFSLVQYARRRRDDETFLALSTCSHAVQIELAVRGASWSNPACGRTLGWQEEALTLSLFSMAQ